MSNVNNMSNLMYILLTSFIIITLLIVTIFVIIKMKNRAKENNIKVKSSKLVQLLGGDENIKNIDVSQSRLKVELVDVSHVNKEEIQSIGAKGVVEVGQTIHILFGSESSNLKNEIEKMFN